MMKAMVGAAVLFITALAVGWPQGVAADAAVGSSAAPAPPWAKSIEVVNDGAPVMLEADSSSRRRGTVGAGTRLGFTRRVFGEGCSTGVWYETSDELFICEGHVQPSGLPPGATRDELTGPGARLPQRYAFVRFDGTRAYAHPSDYFRNDYSEALGKGYGIVITGKQVYEGVEFIRTRRYLWIERGSVHFVDGSPFTGEKLRHGELLDVAWVSPRPAKLHATPNGRALKRLDRHQAVRIESSRGAWSQLAGGGWMRNADLARAGLVEPPEGVGATDRWIDIDIDEQVLVAYEGRQPTFATLVSTGRNSKQSETPLGVFQIWAKLEYSDMDDIERTDVDKNYSIQDVPWVQFFKGSYGFHAAFWHNDFGRRRSHGCINLSPADARYLFQFSQPVLPPGWNAILPMPEDRPTTVQVRARD
ncbi:MAG: murein L,D-transpeptidase [Deltaproteobacteria bacterium]|nr:MAG: murein L,D-transpeptidase [Deltaproteobacteria bacterium]